MAGVHGYKHLPCPHCGKAGSKVIDSRVGKAPVLFDVSGCPGWRRRRQCKHCGKRWTTAEFAIDESGLGYARLMRWASLGQTYDRLLEFVRKVGVNGLIDSLENVLSTKQQELNDGTERTDAVQSGGCGEQSQIAEQAGEPTIQETVVGTCPYEHTFGKDFNRYDECDVCTDDVYEACEKMRNESSRGVAGRE